MRFGMRGWKRGEKRVLRPIQVSKWLIMRNNRQGVGEGKGWQGPRTENREQGTMKCIIPRGIVYRRRRCPAVSSTLRAAVFFADEGLPKRFCMFLSQRSVEKQIPQDCDQFERRAKLRSPCHLHTLNDSIHLAFSHSRSCPRTIAANFRALMRLQLSTTVILSLLW